jgi:hypothetical protein
MIDIKAVYSSDAFSLVKGPSSAIARINSIAEYGQRPTAFHHIVVSICGPPGAWQAARGGIQALARVAGCAAVAAGCGLGRGGKNP